LAFTAFSGSLRTGTSRDCPLRQRHRGSRGRAIGMRPKAHAMLDSSLGVRQRSPLRRHEPIVSTPGWPKPAFGVEMPLHTRSVLVVPPDFDGFRHDVPCRSIAPCSRPWGSLRFGNLRRSTSSIPWSAWPFGAFPSLVATIASPGLPLFTATHAFPPLLQTEPASISAHWLESSPDLKALLHQRVRCHRLVLPRTDARCSLGLWTDMTANRRAVPRHGAVGPGGQPRWAACETRPATT
jgi:hypothetical protein